MSYYSTILLILSLYYTQYAIAIKCYQCSSAVDFECVTKPAQEKFLIDCKTIHPEHTESFFDNFFYTNQSDSLDTNIHCFKAKMHNGGLSITGRGCSPKIHSCEVLKNSTPDYITIDFCNVCEKDFCND